MLYVRVLISQALQCSWITVDSWQWVFLYALSTCMSSFSVIQYTLPCIFIAHYFHSIYLMFSLCIPAASIIFPAFLLTPFLSCIHSFFCLALPTTIYVSLHIYLFSISPSYPLPLPIFPFIPSTFDFVWQESPKEKGLFSILTYVGCGISILCLLASIIFFISLK